MEKWKRQTINRRKCVLSFSNAVAHKPQTIDFSFFHSAQTVVGFRPLKIF